VRRFLIEETPNGPDLAVPRRANSARNGNRFYYSLSTARTVFSRHRHRGPLWPGVLARSSERNLSVLRREANVFGDRGKSAARRWVAVGVQSVWSQLAHAISVSVQLLPLFFCHLFLYLFVYLLIIQSYTK